MPPAIFIEGKLANGDRARRPVVSYTSLMHETAAWMTRGRSRNARAWSGSDIMKRTELTQGEVDVNPKGENRVSSMMWYPFGSGAVRWSTLSVCGGGDSGMISGVMRIAGRSCVPRPGPLVRFAVGERCTSAQDNLSVARGKNVVWWSFK